MKYFYFYFILLPFNLLILWLQVSNQCCEALAVCESIIHPRAPTLHTPLPPQVTIATTPVTSGTPVYSVTLNGSISSSESQPNCQSKTEISTYHEIDITTETGDTAIIGLRNEDPMPGTSGSIVNRNSAAKAIVIESEEESSDDDEVVLVTGTDEDEVEIEVQDVNEQGKGESFETVEVESNVRHKTDHSNCDENSPQNKVEKVEAPKVGADKASHVESKQTSDVCDASLENETDKEDTQVSKCGQKRKIGDDVAEESKVDEPSSKKQEVCLTKMLQKSLCPSLQ